MDDDPTRSMLVPRLHPHTQSIMGRSPGEGLYSNLYDKDMSLMRKLMNLDEFQCSNNGSGSVTAPSSDINASKQFHPYTNGVGGGGGGGGIFNGKFTNAANFAASFPYDKQQQQQQPPPPQNGMRSHLHHDGLLKPCYDHFTTPTKAEPGTATATSLDDNFGSNPIAVGGGYSNNNNNNSKKQSSSTTTAAAAAAALFSSNGNGGGFMNQFPHESLFGANNHHHSHHSHHHHHHHHQAFASKLNEINNNGSGSGIAIKLENGGNIVGGQHANDFTKMSAEQQQQNLCSRSSTTLATASNKTEPNEFRNNGNNSGSNNVKDNNHIDDDERKHSVLHHDHSNDGFTQL
jgi:hypothetical protein